MANKIQQKSTKSTTKAVASPQTGLTPTQEQAAILLASGTTITAVADGLGINRGTLYDWQKLPTFQCFYNHQAIDFKEAIRGGLLGIAGEAIEAIRGVLNSDNEANRLKAAMWVVERVSEMPTGETDVRKVLKAKNTIANADWAQTFNEAAYNADLRRFGLSD